VSLRRAQSPARQPGLSFGRLYTMSYYDNNGQWPASGPQNNWDHQTPSLRTGMMGRTPSGKDSDVLTRSDSGASGPTAQDEFAFSYQFDGM
jgi:hypothetical protein